MAWMASNLFVKSEDHDSTVEALSALLDQPDARADQAGVLDPPPPLLVSPAREGWIAITGGRGWFKDLGWAAGELSQRAGGALAVSLEIIGNSYAYRVCEHEGGERRLSCNPDEKAFAGELQDRAAMLSYCDAEREAYRHLIRLGVPPPLCAIGTTPLGYPKASELLGEGTRLDPGAEGGIERSTLEVRVVPFAGEDPPVIPCATGTDFGLMLFEDRYVEGRPSGAALDRLLEIEEEILARAKRARQGGELTLTVTYHGGVHQAILDEMLRQRGRPTAAHVERGERIPWWQFWRHFGRMR